MAGSAYTKLAKKNEEFTYGKRGRNNDGEAENEDEDFVDDEPAPKKVKTPKVGCTRFMIFKVS